MTDCNWRYQYPSHNEETFTILSYIICQNWKELISVSVYTSRIQIIFLHKKSVVNEGNYVYLVGLLLQQKQVNPSPEAATFPPGYTLIIVCCVFNNVPVLYTWHTGCYYCLVRSIWRKKRWFNRLQEWIIQRTNNYEFNYITQNVTKFVCSRTYLCEN